LARSAGSTATTSAFKPSSSINATRAAANPVAGANSRLSVSSLIKPNLSVVQTPGVGGGNTGGGGNVGGSGDVDLSNYVKTAEFDTAIGDLQSQIDQNALTAGPGIDIINGVISATGASGQAGQDGLSAYEVAVANGFVGNEAAWLASLKGSDGANGINGTNGTNGSDGLSAYEIAVLDGFVGSESDWLDSLKGTDGNFPMPTAGDGLYLLSFSGAASSVEKVNITDVY
jgi:integrin beta 8